MSRVRHILIPILALATLGVGVPLAQASTNASISLSPTSGTYTVGEALPITVSLNTGGHAVTAMQGNLITSANLSLQGYDEETGVPFNFIVATPSVANSSSLPVTPNSKSGCPTTFFSEAMNGGTNPNGASVHAITLDFIVTASGPVTASVNTTAYSGSGPDCSTQVLDDTTPTALEVFDSTNTGGTAVNATATGQLNVTLYELYRSTKSDAGIALKFYSAGTNTLVSTDSGVSANSGGGITAQDNTLNDSSTYDVDISVPGYLSRKVTSVTHILSQSLVMNAGQALVPGNFDGSNTIDLSDLITGIRGYNGQTDAAALLAKKVYGGSVNLSALVGLIHGYNAGVAGN
jgi:hypothetical protein